ncbi:MAG: hypothetical protein ACOYUZ_01900 [Patescibacteria group bacterium]
MFNVRLLKDYVLRASGVVDHFEFCKLSDEHAAYWYKLNALARPTINKARDVGDFPPDVDAATILTQEEWDALVQEFDSIHE